MNIVSTKIINTIATNVIKNCHSKKVAFCYNLNTGLIVIILLLIITIIYYHYAKNCSKQEGIDKRTI